MGRAVRFIAVTRDRRLVRHRMQGDVHEECSSSLDSGQTETERILVNDVGNLIRDDGSVSLSLVLNGDRQIGQVDL